ncbi:transketolase C-terminal domain-containing protein, partial [uncultured Anaerotruncus sp.]
MELENRWLRETYVDELIAAAERDERVVILEADLSKAAGTGRFKERFPERTINVGIAEAGMIGTAAGMAAMGKIPFTHTFTPFSTRRVCDQVTLSVAYAGLGVKIMGSDPGVTAELNGGTHMSMEDVAIMRNIPGMTIFEPTDSAQLRAAFPQIVECAGPVYIRLLRRNAVKIFEEGCACTLGKGIVLREGRDVTIAASGIMTAEALDAAELLRADGIDAEVLNFHTVKP